MFHVKHFKTVNYQPILTSYQHFFNMRKILQKLVNYKFTILTLGIIIFLSLAGSNNINTPNIFKFKNSDKLVHFGMYGFLTLIYLMERTGFLKKKTSKNKTKWFYVLWIIIIGAIIEIVQPIIAGREKDIWDFIANTSGVILAYLTFLVISKYYNFNKMFSS